MAFEKESREQAVLRDIGVRRMSIGRYEITRDGVRLAEIRSIRKGAAHGWLVRYRSGGGAVPHVAHRVFASRAAAIESVEVA